MIQFGLASRSAGRRPARFLSNSNNVGAPLSEALLFGTLATGGVVRVAVENGEIVLR